MSVKLTDNTDAILKRMAEVREGATWLEMFSDDFMSRHTEFGSFAEMLHAGGIESVENIDTELLAHLVTERTPFGSFDEMKATAWREWAGGKLSA